MTFYLTKKNTNYIFSSVSYRYKKIKNTKLQGYKTHINVKKTEGAFFPSHHEMVLNSKLSFNQEFKNKILGNINRKLPQKVFQPILFVLRPKSKVSLKYITWPALKQNEGSTSTDHFTAKQIWTNFFSLT